MAIDNALSYEELKTLGDQLHTENVYLQEEIQSDLDFEEIIGESNLLRHVFHRRESVAATDSTVLIRGVPSSARTLTEAEVGNITNGNRHQPKRITNGLAARLLIGVENRWQRTDSLVMMIVA